MRLIHINILILIFASIIMSNKLYAQSNCLPAGGEFTSGTATLEFDYWGEQGTVEYQYRQNSGTTFDFSIDWSTLNNTSTFMSDEAMRDFMIREAAKEIILSLHDDNWIGYISYYYQTECKVNRNLIYEMETENDFECCDPGSLTSDWYKWLSDGEGVDHKVITVTKQITCGYKCCKKVYHYRAFEHIAPDVELRDIELLEDPVVYSLGDCVCNETYYDCAAEKQGITREVPCTGNCE